MPSNQVGNVGTDARVAVGENITWIEGFTADQVRGLIEAATKAAAHGATETLTTNLAVLSNRLGVTEDAVKALLRIVGEQDVPLDRLPGTLRQVANDYKRLRERVAALNPDNATANALVTRAKALIDSGDLELADQLLREAMTTLLATAESARKLRREAERAETLQLLEAQAVAQLSHGLLSKLSDKYHALYHKARARVSRLK